MNANTSAIVIILVAVSSVRAEEPIYTVTGLRAVTEFDEQGEMEEFYYNLHNQCEFDSALFLH